MAVLGYIFVGLIVCGVIGAALYLYALSRAFRY